MKYVSTEHRNALLCGALALIAIAATKPFAECGVNDDWSYTKTALGLAETGVLRYQGWAEAMVGVQAYWGAAWIKLFGFSFLTTRLSTAPLAAGCGALLYLLHRRSGLRPAAATFGALVIVLSPIFIPHAASFMTEVPAFFLSLASVYGYVRFASGVEGTSRVGASGDCEDSRHAEVMPLAQSLGWLAFAIAAGVAAGSVRQIYWLLPLCAPLYLFTTLKNYRRRRFVAAAVCGSALIAGGAAAFLVDWFYDQPSTTPPTEFAGLAAVLHSATLRGVLHLAVDILLTVAALTLPIVAGLVFCLAGAAWRRGALLRASIAIIGASGIIAADLLVLEPKSWSFPWLPNTFAVTPYLQGTTAMPRYAVAPMLPWNFWRGFSFLTIAATSILIAAAITSSAFLAYHRMSLRAGARFLSNIPLPLGLFASFAIASLPLLVVKSLLPGSPMVFDRYLLPILPAATIMLLLAHQRLNGGSRPRLVAWLLLGGFAYYGIAQTHDYFALLRTRLALTDALEARGIPRTRILGGYEYDGWTQVTVEGPVPAAREGRARFAPPLPFKTIYGLAMYWRAVRPGYIISLAPHPELTNSDLKKKYHTWLPPFQRWVLVEVVDPTLAPIRSLPISK